MAMDEGRHVLRAWLETCRFHMNFGCVPVLCTLLVTSHQRSVSVCRSCALLLADAGIARGGYSFPWPSVGVAVPVHYAPPICLSPSACFRVSGFACLPSWFLCLFPSALLSVVSRLVHAHLQLWLCMRLCGCSEL
jgi:hypothetical protein